MRPIINLVDLNFQHLEVASTIALAYGCIPIPFENEVDFLNSYDRTIPGCSILGLSCNFTRTVDCLTRLKSMHSDAQTILLSDHWELTQIVQAMKLGAAEIIDNSFTKERLQGAIEATLGVDHNIRQIQSDAIPEAILERLSLEDSRIFSAMVRGRTTKQVAAELDISVRTVHYRKKALLEKIGVKDRSEAIELVRKMRMQNSMVA